MLDEPTFGESKEVADSWQYDERRPDVWSWLQAWYVGECNGDWEHQYGIKIETLDNPGWLVTIDLTGTRLENIDYSPQEIHRSEDDWLSIRVESKIFRGAGGPLNLGEILHAFRVWASP